MVETTLELDYFKKSFHKINFLMNRGELEYSFVRNETEKTPNNYQEYSYETEPLS